MPDLWLVCPVLSDQKEFPHSTLLDSNPDLKNDTSMGVIVGEFRILYNSFDNKEAAGKVK